MKTIILATAAILGFTLAGASADAGGISFYYGGGSPYGSSYGLSYSNSSYGYGGIGHGSNYGSSYLNNYYRGPRNNAIYHDTSHYDYVPTRVVPHGNHYDVQPGGYYYHQTGHVDRLHGNHIHHGW